MACGRPCGKDGTLWVWGSGSSAQMGNGVRNPSPDDIAAAGLLLPMQVKGIAGAKDAAVGAGRIAALVDNWYRARMGHERLP